MSESIFYINTITSDGAKLIQSAASNSDYVYIYKAAFLPAIFNRNDAANLQYLRFIHTEFSKYVPQNTNVSSVSKGTQAEGGGCVFVQTTNSSSSAYPVKSIVLFACLYSERAATHEDVVFAVLSDDNSNLMCRSDGLSVSIPMNVDSKYIKLFGKDDTTKEFDDIKEDITEINTAIGVINDDIDELKEFNIDENGDAQTGINYTIKKDTFEDVVIPRDSVILSCELIDGAIVLTTGNGDQFTLSGEGLTIEKTNMFDVEPDPEEEQLGGE